MDCRAVDRLIDDWLDQALDAERSSAIEAHLADCTACRHKHGGMVHLLTSPAKVAVPADLRDRVVGAVLQRAKQRAHDTAASSNPVSVSRPRTMNPRLWLWPAAVAACVAFFVLGRLSPRWWTPEPSSPVGGIVQSDSAAQPATVVLSPWALASWAQATTLRGPASPILFVTQTLAAESATQAYFGETPVERCNPGVGPLPSDPGADSTRIPLVLPLRPSLGV